MTRNWLVSTFFIALLLFVFYQIVLIFSPFLQAIFWAALLAFAFYPVFKYLLKLFKNHEVMASFVTTAAVLLVVMPFAIVVFLKLSEQVFEFFQALVAYVKDGRLEQTIDHIRSYGVVSRFENEILTLEVVEQNLSQWILTTAKRFGNFTVEQIGIITKNVVMFNLGILLTFFLMFVFLKDGHKIYQFIYQIAPLDEQDKKAVFGKITETFAAVIRGQFLTGFTQALLAGIIFQVLGLPVPILVAGATFLCSFIPVTGASTIWVPFVIYLFVNQLYAKAVWLLVLGFFLISMVDNFLKPALIGERTKLPFFLLFLGILGGMKLYGLLGIFLAPVVLALFFALTKIYLEKYMIE